MILTIKYADFSSANIGTLNTYIVSKSIGLGAIHEIPAFVDKNSSVEWVITLSTDYIFGTYTITMGSETITPTVDGNTMTISIPNVTGNIRIAIATYSESGDIETPEPEVPEIPTVYRTDKTLGIQFMEFGDLKFQSNSTTKSPQYRCQVVACDVSKYIGKTIAISACHAWIKDNATYGVATYAFFLNSAPNDITPEMLPNITDIADCGTVSSNKTDVIIPKEIASSIIVERFDIVSEDKGDTYCTKLVTVPIGAKYLYFTSTRKAGDIDGIVTFN